MRRTHNITAKTIIIMTDFKFVCNAFSLQMVVPKCYKLSVTPINKEDFDVLKSTCPSAVGHQDTAHLLGVAFNRANVKLNFGDKILVAQLMGGRLPEGATTLPEGMTIEHFVVEVLRP